MHKRRSHAIGIVSIPHVTIGSSEIINHRNDKLAYFIRESGEPMRLTFVAYTFGPYAQAREVVTFSLLIPVNVKTLHPMPVHTATLFFVNYSASATTPLLPESFFSPFLQYHP
jgi:hypothetical protein